jgi:phytoene/squalene synthetase
MPNKLKLSDDNVAFCDDILGKVSRSFAAVIRQLPSGLCIDILIFYLVLRALDTVEGRALCPHITYKYTYLIDMLLLFVKSQMIWKPSKAESMSKLTI